METITFHGTSGDDSVTATFSIKGQSNGHNKNKVSISANIHADHGRIFSVEACKKNGHSCHVFIEDNYEPEEDPNADNFEEMLAENRAVGHGKR